MEVKLDKRYPVAAGIEACWSVLKDIRAVAACMPGAQITEQQDETHFKGTVKSKVGPAVMSFGGDIELQGLDAGRRSLQMLGKGADKSGSSASMQLTAHLEADPAGGTVLVGVATIVVSGKLAQFGSRLLVPVSDAMLAQFADNFRATAAAHEAAAAPVADAAATPAADPDAHPAADPSADPSATAPAAAAAVSTIEAAAARMNGSAAAAGAAAPAAPAAPAPARAPATAPRPVVVAAPVKELNALALMWTVFKGWLAGLFGRKH